MIDNRGDADMAKRTNREIIEHDIQHRGRNSGCWEWHGSIGPRGYGRVSINRKNQTVHRYVLQFLGHDMSGLHARHRCRSRNCYNPDHLEPGTPKENQADRLRDGTRFGEVVGSAKLSRSQVVEIRAIGTAMTQVQIANRFGISARQVRNILNRRSWPHVS